MKLRKKYRVFIFQPYPKFGGADRSIIRLINGNKNADFTLVSLTKCNYSKYLNKKIKYLEIKSSRVLFSFFKLREKIKYAIDKNEYDKNIFISNQNFANVISILSVYKIKNLKTILIERNHLLELRYSKNIYDLLKKKIILNLIKFSYKKSNVVVGISKRLSSDLGKFIGKKVKTIYNPATDKSIYSRTKKNQYPAIFNKKKEKIILNVGFFEKQKDQITIIKAFSLVKRKYKNVKLLLIGRGALYENLKNYVVVNDLKKDVIFFSNINNPKEFYKKADLFILSSIYEGFGNVLVEALQNKCPVITSNCKSGPMEIIGNGKYGYYFNVGDYYQLSNKIIKFIKDPKELKKRTIRFKKIIRRFSLKENSNNFEKLFRQI
tara:strand:- start:656 stop:1789 length:1134 start_codon:yes stop_codon:yes gene_type:complete